MDTSTPSIKITKNQRFYQLHAEERKKQSRERYNNDPEVIRKREEREKLKAEKEAAKEAVRQEKQKIKDEKLKLAIQTSQIKNPGGRMQNFYGNPHIENQNGTPI
jgi:hypothetical protein